MKRLPLPISFGAGLAFVAFATLHDFAADTALAPQPRSGAGAIPLAESNKWKFGPETNGLCAAVELTENQELTGGQSLNLNFRFRNVSDHDIQLLSANPRVAGEDEVKVTDDAGREMQVRVSMCLIYFADVRTVIKPGEEVALAGQRLVFLISAGDAEMANQPCGYSVPATPGKYALHFALHFRDIRRPGDQPADWHGTVETASMKIIAKAQPGGEK